MCEYMILEAMHHHLVEEKAEQQEVDTVKSINLRCCL